MASAKTERINVWLKPEQVEWLKSKKNVSETVRALVTEAMNMENLAKSVKAGRAKGGSTPKTASKKAPARSPSTRKRSGSSRS
jgi:hypothetical protein